MPISGISLEPLFLVLVYHPQHKVDDDSAEERNSEDGGTEAIIEAALATLANRFGAPVEGDERIRHGGHGNEGEQAGADLTDPVAEVEKTDGETAQNHGEVEP